MNYNILDELLDPTIIVNSNKQIIYYNHYFSVFAQVTPRILAKHPNLFELISSSTIEIEKFISSAISTQNSVVTEEATIEFINQPVSYDVVLKIIPLPDQSILLNFKDISVEKRLFKKYKKQMEELRQGHEQIIQADKLKTLGELTASISHEISNPLTIATGSLEFIRMELEDLNILATKPDLSGELDDLYCGLKRINDIITNMKHYLHKKQDEKEYHLLQDILERASSLVKPALHEEHIKIKLDESVASVIVHCNQIRLEQVFVNLFHNSIQAISNAKTPQGEISIKTSFKNHSIIIDICDNGPGVAKEHQDQIFDSFFTTKKLGEGTGLGLSICKKIIESHNGSLEFIPSQTGAQFRIILPMVELGSYSSSKMASALENRNPNSLRILVLDNEPQVLNIMERYVSDEGHIFLGATDPNHALSMISDLDIDLIITDILMPQMNGHEFALKVRQHLPHLPIVYLSSKDNINYYHQDCQSLGIVGIIFKPFNKDELVTAINQLMNKTQGDKQ